MFCLSGPERQSFIGNAASSTIPAFNQNAATKSVVIWRRVACKEILS
jgi:hypothetical protein